jgi:hypothetical protein
VEGLGLQRRPSCSPFVGSSPSFSSTTVSGLPDSPI